MSSEPWTPDTPTYKLLAEKMGRDPLDYIRERRSTTPPTAFARIADEMRDASDEYITHEVPRRWLREAENRAQPTQAAA